MSDGRKTIIYVSSNRENPDFEKKTRENLLKNCGDIPIIAVTQKPVDLGKNCINVAVGDIGVSGFNFCRQVLMACKLAKTEFVISAESDCIYPPDYFTFTPPRNDIPYRNNNIFVVKYRGNFANKKNSSTFSQIIGRKFYINRLENLFLNLPQWNTEMKNFPKEIGKVLFEEFAYWETENPCVSFKTGNGMRKHSATGSTEIYDLPYWGNVSQLRNYYENQ